MIHRRILPLTLILIMSVASFAQEKEAADTAAAQANNPLANMTALNFHNYYIPKLTDAPDDAYMNTSWIRFAKPLVKGRLLFRLSAPLNTAAFPDGLGSVDARNGLGDINAFVSYSFVSKPTATLGVGPLVVAPTATDDALGAGKWQGGLAFIAFIAGSPVFQFGGLVTWQASFAGDPDRSSTNLMAVQPIYFFQLGKGTYLRGAPIWAFDIKNSAYHIPLALGFGQVVKVGNTVFNRFIEPQYSMLHKGTQPQFQLFTGLNIQFLN